MQLSDIEVTLLDKMGSDLTVVNAARVSFNKESVEFSEKDSKLINYLAQHGHWSPFGHCQVQFRIKAPIFVARQLVKHQIGLCWNEVSRRYVDSEPEFYIPDLWRSRPDGSVKQGSGGAIEDALQKETFSDLTTHLKFCLVLYNSLLKKRVAPEQARMVLPLNTMTEWWWTGSLYAFARVCRSRMAPNAQYECRLVAEKISQLLQTIYPVSWKSLTKFSEPDHPKDT